MPGCIPTMSAWRRKLIPSTRVFRRTGREGAYVVLRYGDNRLPVKPTLQHALVGDGFDLGDQVEVCSQMGKNRPFLATICEMDWNAHFRVIYYRLRRRDDSRPALHGRRLPTRRWLRARVACEVARCLTPAPRPPPFETFFLPSLRRATRFVGTCKRADA